VVEVRSKLPLVEGCPLHRMDELQRVLEGDDVRGSVSLMNVEDRRQCRGLP